MAIIMFPISIKKKWKTDEHATTYIYAYTHTCITYSSTCENRTHPKGYNTKHESSIFTL